MLVALAGLISALNAPLLVAAIVAGPVTFMDDARSVITTVQVAFLPLESFANAVMVTLPDFTGFTTPAPLTFAIVLLLLVHMKSAAVIAVPSVTGSASRFADRSYDF